MSFTATFYTFSKKKNSTARPTSGGTSKSIVVKEPSSILNPTIMLTADNPVAFNYCHISRYNRYYFITDWTSDHGFWIAHLSVDVLATYRTQLRSSSQYVDRCSQLPEDYAIIDGKYAITAQTEIRKYDITGTSGTHRPFMNSQKYIISTTTGGDNSVGVHPAAINGAAYYCLSPGTALSFINYLLSDASYLTLDPTECSDALAKVLLNPSEYIGETYILPFDPENCIDNTQIPLPNANMFVGWWCVDPSNPYAYLPSRVAYHKFKVWESDQIVLSDHPQTSTVGEFVNCSAYSSIDLFAGVFGYISIDPSLLINYTALKLEVYADFKGGAELDILVGGVNPTTQQYEYTLWRKMYANVAIPISISQLSSRAIEGVTGAVGGAASAVTSYYKGDAIGTVQGVGTAILSAPAAAQPKSTGNAMGASTVFLMDNWFITCEYRLITSTSFNLKGRPYCKEITLSDLNTGFVQVSEPVLELACYDQEFDQISQYMEGGFFLE